MRLEKILMSKKGLTWEFIAKIIIVLAVMGILIYIIVLAGKNMGTIIQKIKEIF